MRLLGGVGVAAHRHGPVPVALTRSFADIDVVVGRKGGHALAAGLATLGYTANDRFNALHGARRLLFYDAANTRQLDVFVGEFAMCHRLDLNGRLDLHPLALGPADLLLTKLQIVEINSKDVVDAVRLVLAHEVRAPDLPADADRADALSLDRLVGGHQGRLGLVHHVRRQPEQGAGRGRRPARRGRPPRRCATASTRWRPRWRTPRRLPRWKARSLLGRRSPWYELPEEVDGARR